MSVRACNLVLVAAFVERLIALPAIPLYLTPIIILGILSHSILFPSEFNAAGSVARGPCVSAFEEDLILPVSPTVMHTRT